MFDSVIALAEEFAARIERSVGKRFDDVPAADHVSRTELDWLDAEPERLIADTFGSDSDQMRTGRPRATLTVEPRGISSR